MGGMRTVGIDLSADRSKTAMSVLEWTEDGMAVVGPPALKCTDDVLLNELSGLRPVTRPASTRRSGGRPSLCARSGCISSGAHGRAVARTASATGRTAYGTD